MNAVSIPGSEEFEVLSPSCIEIVQSVLEATLFNHSSKRLILGFLICQSSSKEGPMFRKVPGSKPDSTEHLSCMGPVPG
ncbi:hypothetical protein AVEN_144270-1 [Araneus ventricosus]|uniref:Uncharacterized protein n=1 Tax=Araneus ventricosus TaxID=182803 RepID=A0A4Y2HA62_ARAVE|nr:hypothetical protein AVEN_144270-1 [Araneus ventricosus]